MDFAYHRFAAAAEPIGIRILLVAVSGIVSAIGALVIYTVQARRHPAKPGALTLDEPMTGIVVRGMGISRGRSKRQVLASASGFVSTKSLVDGTATRGDRWAVGAIVVVIGCFLLMFVGIGLMAMASNPLAILLPSIPAVFVFRFARDAWSDYRNAKRGWCKKGLRHS